MSDDTSKRLAILETINRLNAKLRDIKTDQEAFTIIASELKNVTGADYAGIALVEKDDTRLRFVGSVGVPAGNTSIATIEMDASFRKRISEAKHSIAIRFNSQAELPGTVQAIAKVLETDHAILSSILLRGEFLGYLVIGKKEGSGSFGNESEDFLVAIAEDISMVVENVRSSLEVRTAKEETERILALAPVGIFTCDSKGIFTSVNRQMMNIFDLTSEADLIGTSVFELSVISKSGLDALIMSGMEGHEGEKADVHMVPRSDKAFYLHAKVTPIESASGDTQGVLFVAMDITSKVRLQN